MFHPEKKYSGNFRAATGFKASYRLNAAFTRARQDAHGKSDGQYDAAVPLNEHPQAMRLFMIELLEQLNKGRDCSKGGRVEGP